MSFILDQQRDADCKLAFQLYAKHLELNKWRFPPKAFNLASSDWWYDFSDKRCPHDGRITSTEFIESTNSEGDIEVSLIIRLAGAWAEETHEIIYHKVISYQLTSSTSDIVGGHGDWRYDEFRIDDQDDKLLHEIEWGNGAHWLIKCDEVEHVYKTNQISEQDASPNH